LEGWAEKPPVKNGPSPGGNGAVAMNAGLRVSMMNLPEQRRNTLIWDCGEELSGNAKCALDTGTRVFFADPHPHSPWHRPTNENTKSLLRQYFPKGTDLCRWSATEIKAVTHALNTRPGKTLGWRTHPKPFASN
jgi:IS30 family transposase